MAVEAFNYLNSLNPNFPSPTDGIVGGDDHLRGIKATLKATFPNITGEVTASHTTLTRLEDGAVRFADGTAEAPSIAFASKPSVGFRLTESSSLVEFVGARMLGDGLVSVGAIVDFPYVPDPAQWAVCDGQAVSRTDAPYARLFAKIGITFGAGNGSTTFNLPNAKNRYRRHRDDAGMAGAANTFQAALLGSHTHNLSGVTDPQGLHGHNYSGNTSTESATHTHTFSFSVLGGSLGGDFNAMTASPGGIVFGTGGQSNNHVHSFGGVTDNQGVHQHNVSGTALAAGGSETRPTTWVVYTCIKL